MKKSKFVLSFLSFLIFFISLNLWANPNTFHYPYEYPQYSNNISNHFQFETQIPNFPLLSIQLGMDLEFTADQQLIIRRSLPTFLKRSLQSVVINCAFRSSHKDLPASKEFFMEQLYSALAPVKASGFTFPSFLFMAKFSNYPGTVGIGYIDLFNDTDQPFPGQTIRHYLHIALNGDYLGESSHYQKAKDINYWAGVISHEVLHNLGYTHETGMSGSFIAAYGKCIEKNGIGEININDDELMDLAIPKL